LKFGANPQSGFLKLLDWRVNGRQQGFTQEHTAQEPPLRSELLSADQMEQRGEALAATHVLSSARTSDHLLSRLAKNEGVLVEVCELLTSTVKASQRITPGGEWLLDNFYLIEEQIRTAKKHLPKRYSQQLPRLGSGASAGLPRVYDIALAAISHGDGRVDLDSLSRFVGAYQKVTYLALGELWAIPIMLRLALLENLRRVGAALAASVLDRRRADRWAQQMLEVVEEDPTNLILVIADMARSSPALTSSFVAEFARLLQGQSSALALPLTWIEQRLSQTGLTIEQLVQSETQKQAAAQVSISNSIGSLRFLGATDWREFVESMSFVEQKLREDPADVYGKMEFAARDRYRHAVERIAKRSRLPESEVARKVIQLAHEGRTRARDDPRTAHVGYYLVHDGMPQLERATHARLALPELLEKAGRRFPVLLYLGGIALLTALFTSGLVSQARADGLIGWQLALFGIPIVLAVSQLAVALVNWLATLVATPHPLPRLDYSAGIPAEDRTLVVIPCMLTDNRNIGDLVEALEVRYLANRNAHLHFALLSDFVDAKDESLPEDDALVALARDKITALNEKYRDGTDDKFFLFHRPRRWNERERLWMGYERKRGKLSELNALLRERGRDRFSVITGDTTPLINVRYVITLDTDTQLPRDSARSFIGTMSHPLNRPRIDAKTRCVREGYGILQPRVALSLAGANRSDYARLSGADAGIDPYTRAVSDVYQDVFGEGSFIGKGIYDVDAFEMSLDGRFPDNRILSHDLLEGCYARSGLLSDVQLYEGTPSTYAADAERRHRWVRGDWQIAQWLSRRVPAYDGAREKNPLSILSQWKILDNLRRSLVSCALLMLLAPGWLWLPSPAFWTLVVLGIVLIPSLIGFIPEQFQKPKDVLLDEHVVMSLRSALPRVLQAAQSLILLPFEAFNNLDAIIRTLSRLMVTRRRLLEWVPSGARPTETRLAAYWRLMWIAPVIAGALTAYFVYTGLAMQLFIAGPLVLAWFGSPVVAWWVSRPLPRKVPKLSNAQLRFLNKSARRIWGFFESFVVADEHWLPPDNYQEHPVEVVAHRTSPTNMGLALLANLAAYDFGYIAGGELVERTGNTLDTMSKLNRYQGHFYNWYDTQTLQPLAPLYVSSVDSGNLAAHVLTVRQGLMRIPNASVIRTRVFDGLGDTLHVLAEVAREAPRTAVAAIGHMQRDLESAYDSRPATFGAAYAWLNRLSVSARSISDGFTNSADADATRWAESLARQCNQARDDLVTLAPWVLLPESPPGSTALAALDHIRTLRDLANMQADVLPSLVAQSETAAEGIREWLSALCVNVAQGSRAASARLVTIERLIAQAGEFSAMKYDFLYDQSRHLLAIGYNASERRRDASYYDLLASEARLASFVAIAQGELPQQTWFALGRMLTTTGGEPTLLSWSGSMFEYLMPLLVMPTYENTLLDQTYQAVVKRQIAYGKSRGVAWGISESGYNTVDASLNYQYRAFGVPGTGLKRGLAEDLVVAPYASALALMVAPEEACTNLQRLASEGVLGRYGFYEAVDYTPSRLQRGQSSAIVRSYMAHHQAMHFLSLAYLLLDQPMQRRFEADPLFQATALLLQERVPRTTGTLVRAVEVSDMHATSYAVEMPVRVITSATTPTPQVQLLSNGRYHVMVTNAGGGYSRWKDLAVTRWHEDVTCDNWGMFCYIRDVTSGVFWSSSHQPTLKRAETYEAIFSEGRAEFRRRDSEYDTHTEIVVSPEDDIELRRVHITNRSRTRREIDVTSYAEIVLAVAAADAMHPAFSNLFVQTEILEAQHAILCSRRARSQEERPPWMCHLMAVHGAQGGQVSYETDRMRFIGRGRTLAAPFAMSDKNPLSGSAGSVLDPIAAIRYRIALEAEQSATIDIVSGIGETREAALNLAGKYQDRRLADRVFDLAWTHSQVVLRQINATQADAQLYGRLASSVVYANSSLRADAGVIAKNRRGQSGLWGYAISGDLPIVLLQILDLENIDLVRQLVQAHAYWRLKGLSVDLMIWNEDHTGYRQLLQDQILGLVAAGVEGNVMDRPGGIFVRRGEQISDEDRVLIQSVARIVITDKRGMLADQMNRRTITDAREAILKPRFVPLRSYRAQTPAVGEPARSDLLFYNGLGGFAADGTEYVITTRHGEVTPAPWVNVLANANFGCVISESGFSYTWDINAHEFRLTPWNNDPVTDTGGECFYMRDEESGHFWSPTPLPSRASAPYITRHGFGYSVFEHTEAGITTELCVYVARDAPVKFSVLKVRNESGRARQLSATGYVEWVLGDLRSKTMMHIITETDVAGGTIFARNPYNSEFADRAAFFDVDDATRTFTCDRTEFIGRNGTLKSPAAMTRSQLASKLGVALDPCAAIQVGFELDDGEEREIIFRLGAGQNIDDATQIARRWRGSAVARGALADVREYWKHTLSAVQIETPDPSLDVLTNGWLIYQTLACRVWARSGYYQSGGAFGYRDQLQDVMALVHADPAVMRNQLLLCASRQFKEGDVQHWWHPPLGRGVRTHCSDDFLWLPLATCRYVVMTGDTGVLDETIHFLEGRHVNPDEDSYYDRATESPESATLYQHCVRAIERGLRFGEHGLPLMGSGDWNDGMNLVGIHGKGESVWLAFFLYEVLQRFYSLAKMRGDQPFADRCLAQAAQLSRNIDQHGWDGEWYRRAYFDDGSPLGSAANDECKIDSISQSWSVLSGAGEANRARKAMDSLDTHLVRRDHALIQLLDPPFDKSALNPGYIKGYVPGVRENGGQYTHSAVWATMAFAALGDSKRAWELFSLINPVRHGSSASAMAVYKVEPYVVAADVYAVSPHIGRGGWTWYTGSAGWTYRLILESLLGLRLHVDKLHFAPCLPAEWDGFKLRYRYRRTVYQIAVIQVQTVASKKVGPVSISVDGVAQSEPAITMIDDGLEHHAEVRISRTSG
jgi:cellobiose phosphorylase